ncbi:rab-GTPase-TBC domain protein (macronuclear) [Tetrahymena thermophila SB210]|uniref:Rab-GTPase-TBC domain protein n=1 Tax=Tetrahymena thermophila (strain SB210) TaxID=312017 RepID=Q23DL2_TETTS|nr:rab-GTPase-TBC domain protein [Tetrahymena thermophila SB210]EAR94714.2 rab-GTPase-TBC domain protein [Tetrahymena thermophila SB210]|eukprot:XP_001014674.2 rab-GTPase-TBC domain protein [Tetrahymena thermophila SB210]
MNRAEDNYRSQSQLREKTSCQVCHKKLVNLEYCLRCSRALCEKCYQKGNQSKSICQPCVDECIFMQKQIMQFKPKWCQQSSIGREWAQHLLDKDFKVLNEEYQEIQTQISKNVDSIKKQIPLFEKVLLDSDSFNLKGSNMNFSFLDFLYKIGFQQNQDTIRPVKNILLAFIYIKPEVGYSAYMKSLVVFLLFFMEESLAYFCFLKLFTEIMPEKIWPSNCNKEVLQKRVKEMSSLTLKFNCVSQSETIRAKYEEFLQNNILKFYSSFVIGFTSYRETFVYFSNLMKEKSFYNVDEYIMIISLINYDAIINQSSNIYQDILYNTTMTKINNFKIQLHEFLDNITSTNQIYSLYKQNQKLEVQKEQLIELMCNLQTEIGIKQSQQDQIESELDTMKFVTEISIHGQMQEETKLQLSVSSLKSQQKELEEQEQNLKESIQQGESKIKELLDRVEQKQKSSKQKAESREVIEMRYLNRQNQLKSKIRQLEEDLKQQDLEIASRTKILEARKKNLFNQSTQSFKSQIV